MSRVAVREAYRMLVGGALVPSESGRVLAARAPRGRAAVAAAVPLASRKDARDAVAAARDAAPGWAARSAADRGRILYRLAEVMEARRSDLRAALARGGEPAARASAEVDAAVDTAVYYAGFCDKLEAIAASVAPVAGPYVCFTRIEPIGVVAVVAPARPALVGLAATVLPAVAAGNACVAVAGDRDPAAALVWAECAAAGDLPAGVVNVLTGHPAEIAPHLARHREVAALDVWGAGAGFGDALRAAAGEGARRAFSHDAAEAARLRSVASAGLGRIEPFVRTKAVWSSVGV